MRAGIALRGCKTTDPLCSAPVTDEFVVPYGEQAKIKVPPGFQGYLEINNPDGLPEIEFLGRPINQDTTGYTLILPTPATVTLLILATGEKYNAEQGIFVYDQDGSLAGSMWYLQMRLGERIGEGAAVINARSFGLQSDREGQHREMWLAAKKIVNENNR